MPNYLYNGVELPELPEWDKEVYPYAVIYTYHGNSESLNPIYRLVLSDTPFVIEQHTNFLTGAKYDALKWAGGYIAYWKTATRDNWGGDGSGTDGSAKGLSESTDAVVWTNSDVLYASDYSDTSLAGTLYLTASDPIPVDGETEAAPITPYLRKNGAWQKQDTYKRVGGQWVKQPQKGYEMVESVWQPIFEEVEEPEPTPEPEPLPAVGTSLEDCTWEQISAISAAGKAAEYFSVGDTKSVHIQGTVGTLELDTTLYVYILGFDHNKDITGDTGITFGTFKTAEGVDVALCDSKYGKDYTDGTKRFNMIHWGKYSYGGWAGSDLRYDILGSTDVAPSGYGATKTTSVVGYDATETCATNPVENTLMSALPADLRAVMKPMTTYADSKGNATNVEENVTASIDYLPLLSEFEVFGKNTYANQYEQSKQAQYAYFAAGNSKVKYNHSSTGSAVHWWERSAYRYGYDALCMVYNSGSAFSGNAYYSYGIAPIFLV